MVPGDRHLSADDGSRRCSMGGMELVEEIVTVDDELRRFQYRITEGPMPLEFHLGTVDVLVPSARVLGLVVGDREVPVLAER